MKIIILGAGQVGRTAAQHLSREEANEVTVVDTDEAVLRDLQDRLDIRTVNGNASSPRVLEAAGIDKADVLVALTNSDEVNMIACQVAYTLFHTPTKIARVRETAYLTREALFDNEAIPVDVLISPEQVVTNYIRRLIEYPGALQVIDFAEDNRVDLIVMGTHGRGVAMHLLLGSVAEKVVRRALDLDDADMTFARDADILVRAAHDVSPLG